MGWILQWRNSSSFPVECPGLTPDQLAGRSLDEIERMPALAGRETVALADLFTIQPTDQPPDRLEIEGAMANLSRLGAGMSAGRLVIRGEVGPLLAASMTGGLVELDGRSGRFTAAEIRGGLVRIRGEAGDDLGAALPGSRLGGRGGAILVQGSAGARVGLRLRRGLIAVRGSVGPDAGHQMIAGTLVLLGPVGPRAGSGLKRGTLIFLGSSSPEISPGFTRACRYRPPFVAIYRSWLADRGFEIPAPIGRFVRYNGDVLANGRGELLVADRREDGSWNPP